MIIIIKNVKKLFPTMVILNEHKIKDYEIGIGELKLGGFATF
jgi:hypothetical protein